MSQDLYASEHFVIGRNQGRLERFKPKGSELDPCTRQEKKSHDAFINHNSGKIDIWPQFLRPSLFVGPEQLMLLIG